jgi:hypothetical protein
VTAGSPRSGEINWRLTGREHFAGPGVAGEGDGRGMSAGCPPSRWRCGADQAGLGEGYSVRLQVGRGVAVADASVEPSLTVFKG